MCGIVVLSGQVPPSVEAMAIAGAGARGPHQHGWAFQDGDGWTVLRYPGRLMRETWPGVIGHPRPGALYIGHSRLATSGARAGDAPPQTEAQPYVHEGRFLIAHNGTIPDNISGREPGGVDTKVLLRELEMGEAPVGMLLKSARPQVVVWTVASAVLACRVNGTVPAHPFYVARGPGWLAASSGMIPGGELLRTGKAVQLL